MLSTLIAACLLAGASAFPSGEHYERDSACVNSASTRSCWKNGFSVATNNYQKVPDTGNTVKVFLEATDETMAPDGIERPMQVFNRMYPGPTIEADWGDMLEITVKNSLKENGTSVHWHGFRQLGSNQEDGVNGVTECPIAPGDTRVYRFRATEYGSSWYHSHHSVQYGDGLLGVMKIRGPTAANYDVDLGVLPITNWYHTPTFALLARNQYLPPTAQNVLVNGSGVFEGKGQYATTYLTPGKKHKLGIVNTGLDSYFHVSLDGHPFTVVAADFNPIKPFETKSLTLAIGQRYDIIIDANQPVENYWFRVTRGGGLCDAGLLKNDSLGSIFRYKGADEKKQPTSTSYDLPTGCVDETNLVPLLPIDLVPPTSPPVKLDLTVDPNNGTFAVWRVNTTTMHIDWERPTLKYVQNNTYTLPAKDNGIEISAAADTWVYWLIENHTPIPHPIHLHGHDFFVVAQGAGSGVGVPLNTKNPIRRDTQTVIGNGHLVIAFKADNPGAWLLHCHIAFHISGGLGLQFLERPTEILKSIGDLGELDRGCRNWDAYAKGVEDFQQPDSGL